MILVDKRMGWIVERNREGVGKRLADTERAAARDHPVERHLAGDHPKSVRFGVGAKGIFQSGDTEWVAGAGEGAYEGLGKQPRGAIPIHMDDHAKWKGSRRGGAVAVVDGTGFWFVFEDIIRDRGFLVVSVRIFRI